VTPEDLERLVQEDGPFAQKLPNFEVRIQQQKMLKDVATAYEEDQIALIEAGTGTGKSLAYLLPAMLKAAQANERTVISTNTINLQEQLINKDIPLVKKILDLDLKVVLAKGMSNYLCLRKLRESLQEQHLFLTEEQEELHQIEGWSKKTTEGSRSGLPMLPTPATWDKVNAEGDACAGKQCPDYKDCFFFRARQQAADANVVVANHHLLFSDLQQRALLKNFDGQAVLPPYKRIILDEAHNIEDIATDHFASKANHMAMLRSLSRVFRERRGHPSTGKLATLITTVAKMFPGEHTEEVAALMQLMTSELRSGRDNLSQMLGEVFSALGNFVERRGSNDSKLRLRQKHLDDPLWSTQVQPSIQRMVPAAKSFLGTLWCLEDRIQSLNVTELTEHTKGPLLDLKAACVRLEEGISLLDRVSQSEEQPDQVCWIEVSQRRGFVNTELVVAALDIADTLSENLFTKFSTIILTSATLATDKTFTFIKNRLGLIPEKMDTERLVERIYASPFDFDRQALIAIAPDQPLPKDPNFLQHTADAILETVRASRGNAFVLFTSYVAMRSCYQHLEKRLREERFHPFKQGDAPREALLNSFRETDYSVLFATDSFWEGVDVMGDALRCVIIVKLPFQVPSEPIVQARCEAISANGGNPFTDYSIPNAIVKFKQGVGRLIRHKSDRGCIVCLDSRLVSKGYGKKFLNSLPSMPLVVGPQKDICREMRKFYSKGWSVSESNR
jgi:ATP-dependent DNA helicase DinG